MNNTKLFKLELIETTSNADKLFKQLLVNIENNAQAQGFVNDFTINKIVEFLPFKESGIKERPSYNYAVLAMLSGQRERDYFDFQNQSIKEHFTSQASNSDRNNALWGKFKNEKLRINPKYILIEKPFEAVWSDILDLLSTTNVIYTLTQNKPNKIVKANDFGVSVQTKGLNEEIPKHWFDLAWGILKVKNSITADDIPEPARFRSSFIMALLGRLEYVRIKRNPVVTLYLDDLDKPVVGKLYPHTYIQSYFSVGNMGGIRYSGPAENPSQCIIITSLDHDSNDRENPYSDRLVGTKLIYTGEGQTGNQVLTKGNLALFNQAVQKYPLFVFERLENDQYRYLGRMQVLETNQEKQKDTSGSLRDVYVFTLQQLSELDSQIAQALPGQHPNEESDTDLLKKLDGIQTELTKTTVKQEKFKRNKELVDTLKILYEHKCQLCDPQGLHIPAIPMKDGKNYVEVHHIEGFGEAVNYISENQEEAQYSIDHYQNAIVLCVYHHKLLHHYRTKVIFDKEYKTFTSIDGTLKISIILNKHL